MSRSKSAGNFAEAVLPSQLHRAIRAAAHLRAELRRIHADGKGKLTRPASGHAYDERLIRKRDKALTMKADTADGVISIGHSRRHVETAMVCRRSLALREVEAQITKGLVGIESLGAPVTVSDGFSASEILPWKVSSAIVQWCAAPGLSDGGGCRPKACFG